MEWFIDGETGLPAESAEKVKKHLEELKKQFQELGIRRTGNGVVIASLIEISADGVKPVNPASLGTSENYFTDIVSANITIPSQQRDKTTVEEVPTETLASIQLPTAKRYVRRGRTELGFIAEEMPAEVKTSQGDIDLKALIAVLAAKITRVEKRLYGGGGV